LKLWLSRLRSGRYLITQYKPILATIGDTDVKDLYIKSGEPVGIPSMCSGILKLVGSKPLKRLESVKIELEGKLL